MKKDTELVKKCSLLPLTGTDRATDEEFAAAERELKKLYGDYGAAEVLGILSSLWPYEKAVEFFSRCTSCPTVRNEIRTVAVYYSRGYNGGVERVNAELMDIWHGMGYKVVFFSDEPENDLDFPYSQAVKRIVLPSREQMRERLPLLKEMCIAERVDVFINHNWTDVRSLWECMLLKTLDIPYVQYCHGHFSWSFSDGRSALYQPEEFKLSDLEISLSETNSRFYQMCGCRSYLVHNPIPRDLKEIVPKVQNESRHILMIGRITNVKYPLEALRIFKMAYDKHPEIVLDVVGHGEQELVSKMKDYLLDNSMEKAVFFHGGKSLEEIADYYNNAMCVLFTSKMEGYPMVVLEAKAYGRPLVMYDMPFLSLTKDKKGILTAVPGDLRTMAYNLISIIENLELRNNLSFEAKESFERLKSYDLEKAWKEIFSICSGETIVSRAFYDPDDLQDEEKIIMPVLFDKMKKGYETQIFKSRDYKLGHFLLKVPRMIKKKIKG